MKKILKFIRNKVFPQKEIIIPGEFKTDDDYYTFFFTKHPKWSKPEPNKAEISRLYEIEKMMQIAIETHGSEKLKIIDFGCGRGWLAKKLSVYGNVVGIEPVANVVKYAKNLYPSIEFEVGSIDKLLDKQVDIIVASEVIEHFEEDNKLKYFKAFNGALKENSFCIITTPRAEVQSEWLSYRKDKGQPIEKWLTEKQVYELAKSSGFEVVSKKILQERANDPNSPILDLYQIWLFKKL